MIGTKYTPNGQWVSSFTRRYTDGWECKTTLFDVGDAELTSTVVDCGTDGFTLGREVAKVGVSSSPKGLSVSFVIDQWPEDGLDKRVVVLSSAASVEFSSGVRDRGDAYRRRYNHVVFRRRDLGRAVAGHRRA